MRETKQEIEISSDRPQEAGAAIMTATALPLLREVAAHLEGEGVAILYAGALGTLLAEISHAIGIDASEALYRGLEPCFDEGRRIRAELASAMPPPGSLQ